MKLPAGKLPPRILKKYLSRIQVRDPRVLVGARYGEDAAVIDLGDRCLVAKTDPITFTARRLGWYAVNINANDVATMGARPMWFLATLLLAAEHADEPMVADIFDDLLRACDDLGVTLCGGHTEVTPAVTQPVLVGQMLGETVGRRALQLADARPGDQILLTKGIAIEGTSIIAREKAEELRGRFGGDLQARAAGFLTAPGISVLNEALAAARTDGVRAMHDPTEGGLAAGLAEVADAAGCGLRLTMENVSVYPECRAICEHYSLDPMGLIASGALLIVTLAGAGDSVAASLRRKGFDCAIIGQLTEAPGLIVATESGDEPLRWSCVDEIAKLP